MKRGRDGLIVQPRDRTLLKSLAQHRILDRRQIERLAGFHSISRVNVRLGVLLHAALIHRYFTSTSTGSRRSVYSLSKRGALEAEVPFVPVKWRPDSFLLGNAFVAHQLALNDFYIAASGNRVHWQQPSQPLSPTIRLIPDAYIRDAQRSFFVEMDLGTEALTVWTKKVTAYVKLAVSGLYRDIIPHADFAVLVVATDDRRLESLRRHIAKQTPKLFWFATLEIIKRQGLWSVVWLRATGETHSLPGA